jgi:hypothetical protein
MNNQLNNIETDIKELKDFLIGSDLNKNGFINRVESLEKYQSNDKKQKWTLAGIGLAIGFLLKFW